MGNGDFAVCVCSKFLDVFFLLWFFMALGLALISGAPSAWLVDQMIRHGIYEEKKSNIAKTSGRSQIFLR